MNRSSNATAGLFFGSFNPVHNGHLVIAQYMLDYTGLDEVWFVVSPQNPFKDTNSLLAGTKRLELVRLAIRGNPKFKACDLELKLGTPSYTIHTLDALQQMYPGRAFALIMGTDNLDSLKKWKDYQRIAGQFAIYAYPRPGYDQSHIPEFPHTTIVKAPMMEISSSLIREMIAQGKDPSYMIPKAVLNRIRLEKLYALM